MDFSDIRTIIIGEAGEYGKRLVRYLEIREKEHPALVLVGHL